MLIFISGISKSGKSSFAEKKLSELANKYNLQKIYLATSKVYDSEFLQRIEIHKLNRKNKNFITIEKSENLNEIINLIPENSAVLLESLSTLVANEMFYENKIIKPEIVFKKICHDIANINSKTKIFIIVSDDIFSDGIFYSNSTEQYIKLLGDLHVQIASESDEIYEVISGIIFNYERTVKFK